MWCLDCNGECGPLNAWKCACGHFKSRHAAAKPAPAQIVESVYCRACKRNCPKNPGYMCQCGHKSQMHNTDVSTAPPMLQPQQRLSVSNLRAVFDNLQDSKESKESKDSRPPIQRAASARQVDRVGSSPKIPPSTISAAPAGPASGSPAPKNPTLQTVQATARSSRTSSPARGVSPARKQSPQRAVLTKMATVALMGGVRQAPPKLDRPNSLNMSEQEKLDRDRERLERQRQMQDRAVREREEQIRKEKQAEEDRRAQAEQLQQQQEKERKAREAQERREREERERLSREEKEAAKKKEAEAAALRKQAEKEKTDKDKAEKDRGDAARRAEQDRKDREERERKDREDRERKDREDKERKEREGRERKEREDRERKEREERERKEREERERKERGDKERNDREERERKEREERERREREDRERKEREDKARKEQEERVRREQEEKTRREQEDKTRREQEEKARKEQQEQERVAREEARKQAEAKAQPTATSATQSASATQGEKFAEGDHVDALWADGNYYPAVVTRILNGGRILVTYPEYQEQAEVDSSSLRKSVSQSTYAQGERVQVRWEDGNFYPAVVQSLDGGGLYTVFFPEYSQTSQVGEDSIKKESGAEGSNNSSSSSTITTTTTSISTSSSTSEQVGIKRSTSGLNHSASGLNHSASGLNHSASGLNHSASGLSHSASGLNHSTSGLNHSTSGLKHSTSGLRHSTSGLNHSSSSLAVPGAPPASGSSDRYPVGTHVEALWQEDGLYYPAVVEKVLGGRSYQVVFTEYATSAQVGEDDIRPKPGAPHNRPPPPARPQSGSTVGPPPPPARKNTGLTSNGTANGAKDELNKDLAMIDKATKGGYFIVHAVGSKPSRRFVACTPDLQYIKWDEQEKVCLKPGPGKTYFLRSQITTVRIGFAAEGFERAKKKYSEFDLSRLESRAFSIVCPDRQLDLEAEVEGQREEWVELMGWLITFDLSKLIDHSRRSSASRSTRNSMSSLGSFPLSALPPVGPLNPIEAPRLAVGHEVEALWDDNKYYKAVIDSLTPTGYMVTYIEYGLSIEVPEASVRLPKKIDQDNPDLFDVTTHEIPREKKEAVLLSMKMVDTLARGSIFTKHNGHKRERRFVMCTGDMQFLKWDEDADRAKKPGPGKSFIKTSDITAIQPGVSSKIFQKSVKGLSQFDLEQVTARSFTIQTGDRTLDLEAPSESVKEEWLEALRWVQDHGKLSFLK